MSNIFIESFNGLADLRVERTKKHLLFDIIVLSLMATISGAQYYTEIELFGKIHYNLFVINLIFLRMINKLLLA